MNKSQTFLLALFALFVISCTKNENSKTFINLNVEEAINQSKSFNIKDKFKNIEFIPLETNEHTLLGEVLKIVKYKGDYYLYDDASNLFRFDSQGKFVARIGKVGKGPEEYSLIADFAVDQKNDYVVVNALGKLMYYTTDGQFVKMLKIDTNEQVMAIDDEGRIFFILPDNAQSADVTSAEIVKVLDADGKLLKSFNTSEIRHSGLPFFQGISQKSGTMYFKPETGNIIYSINSNLEKDSVHGFDLGKYAFTEKDFDMSAMEKWKSKYRLDKIFITDRFTCFNLQNGLIGKDICPLFWDGKELLFPHSEEDPSQKGLFFDGIKVTPMAESNNEIIALVSAVDVLTEKEDLNIESLKKITAESNPVLCIFK